MVALPTNDLAAVRCSPAVITEATLTNGSRAFDNGTSEPIAAALAVARHALRSQ